MTYLVLKYVHLLSMVLLFGTGLGSAFYKWMADSSKNIMHIQQTNRLVVIADWVFTTPTVIIQPVTGIWMVIISNLPFTTTWVWVSLLLFGIAGACWIPVVWLQIKMQKLSDIAVRDNQPLPEQYWKYVKIWFYLGIPAFLSVLMIMMLMVFKTLIF